MTPDLARSLARELATAPYGGQGAILSQWEATMGLSRSTLLRHAKLHGYQPQERKPRVDAGISRAGITEDGLAHVVALMAGSHRKTGSIEMPTNEAVMECVGAGALPQGTKPETVRRILREKGLSRRMLKENYTTDGQTVSAGHVRLVSRGPNHLHQVDVSACLHWYFKKRGGLDRRHTKLELMGGKKPEALKKLGREHILRYILVDHFSGAFYVRYYLAAGENALNLIDFLYQGWRRREHEHDIFHGAPSMVYFDPGSANLAYATTNLLDNLQVKWEAHQAGVARATGAVEVNHRIWQQHFESKLWLRPPENLEELNARADDARIFYCTSRTHRRTRQTRWEAWSGIKAEDLRLMPPREIYNELAHEKPHRTTVRADGMLRHKGLHAVLDTVDVGQRVEVVRNPYRLPEVLAYRLNPDGTRGEVLRTKAIESPDDIGVAVGTWKRRKDTPAQRAVKAAGEIDLSTYQETVFGHKLENLPENVRFLERKGQEITPAAQAPAPLLEEGRPAWFSSGTDRYEWILRHPAQALAEDLAWAREYEHTPEYQAMAESWEQLRAHLGRQAVEGGGKA
ncbi:MAG: hypothetical protein K9K65_06130 [Desulfarculaceae bacterium]|nr:hypothetical protein [Desulfarculaceae bacterium]MCF8097404.1 hypothetical protein [Desulfarculaceae bacterium]MCF8123828.1 hypothetical protein [Desulfarculaceae bacterium]